MLNDEQRQQLEQRLAGQLAGDGESVVATCNLKVAGGFGSDGLLGVSPARLAFARKDFVHGLDLREWRRAEVDVAMVDAFLGKEVRGRVPDGELRIKCRDAAELARIEEALGRFGFLDAAASPEPARPRSPSAASALFISPDAAEPTDPHARAERAVRAMFSGPALVVASGETRGEMHALDPTQGTTIGRTGADLELASGSVSRRHARVSCENGQWYVVDMASSNGTRCNGSPVRSAVMLQDGDRIGVGNFELVFVARNLGRQVLSARRTPGQIEATPQSAAAPNRVVIALAVALLLLAGAILGFLAYWTTPT